MKYYNDRFVQIEFEQETKIIRVALSGLALNSDHFKTVHRKCIEFVSILSKNRKINGLLSDHRKAGAILPEDAQFYCQHFITMLTNRKVKKVAIILPEKSIPRIIHREFFLPKIPTFNDETSAVNWFSEEKYKRDFVKSMNTC